MTASTLKSNPAFTLTTPSDREIVMTRVFDAPRRLVFEAWTKPEHVTQWWGWSGSTLPVCEIDLRSGGAWRFILRTPDGKDYRFKGAYREIVTPERLVYTECYDEPTAGSPEWITTVTFEEHDGKTKLTSTLLHESREARDGHLKAGMEAGAAHSLDRLAEHLTDLRAREIVITRVFDAPRELVFEMWTDPKHLVHWWGPRGFTTTIQEMDVRPGGQWRKIMHGPDGANYPNHSVFLEVVKPERLVYTNGGHKEGGPSVEFEQTVTFDDLGGKTRVTMRHLFPSAEERDRVVKQFNAIEGGNQTLDRLGERLTKMAERELVLTRVFDAPREIVFKAWTDVEHLKRWWGPKNFTNPVCEADVRPGGAMRIHMRGPDGTIHPMTGVYKEIVEPKRLVFTASALDATGNPLFEQMTTVTFEEHGGKTELTVHASFSKVRPEAAPHLAGAEMGWNMSLDRLAEEAGSMSSGLIVRRVFDAPRDLVWKAVTEAEGLMHWWGPKGFTPLLCEVDLRPGGTFRYSLRAPDGSVMWGKWVYGEIVAPELLVSVTSMTDEAGNPMRHPMSKNMPAEVLNKMTLSERDGKTTMTISGVPFNATEEERKAFAAGRDFMEQGFDGTLNKLVAYLAG